MNRILTLLLCCACAAASFSCGAARKRQEPAKSSSGAVPYGYKIVSQRPHDPEAYTQGLFWWDGALIESTGEYGSSTLRRVDPVSGEVLQSVDLGDEFFGEGCARVGDRIFVLTWLEGKCFIFDQSFARVGEFSYRGQGWGLTSDGSVLYMSDGTANIAVRSADDFSVLRTIAVRRDGRTVQYINELEWINGKIWANVYLSNEIIVIDPADGRVEAVLNFAGIESHLKMTPSTDVMNGIAWNGRNVYVTGKKWNRLFEIEVLK